MISLRVDMKGGIHYAASCEFAGSVYGERLQVELDTYPAIILSANEDGKIIGTFGFTPGDSVSPLLIETYFDFDILSLLSCGTSADRTLFGEMGMLTASKNKTLLPLLLSAGLITWCAHNGYEYLALTTTKSVQRLAQPLQIDLIKIGEPNLANKDARFIEKWSKYFSLRPNSVGIKTRQALPGSKAVLARFSGMLDCRRLLH